VRKTKKNTGISLARALQPPTYTMYCTGLAFSLDNCWEIPSIFKLTINWPRDNVNNLLLLSKSNGY